MQVVTINRRVQCVSVTHFDRSIELRICAPPPDGTQLIIDLSTKI